MHIPDGIVPVQICIGGYAVTSLVTWYSLQQINRRKDPMLGVPKAALLTTAFFVASLIHIPIPPASVHLVLNGMLGCVLGYYAFPAILIGLFFQAATFGHGGISTLGINALIMGIPALVAYYLFQLRHTLGRRLKPRLASGLFAFLAGAFGLGLSALIFFTVVITTIPSDLDAAIEQAAVFTLLLAHIPLALIEGTFTAMLVLFLERVKPELLQGEW
ncbi:cobalt transporter CbiM [Leptothermofonsia sp. ETS-13]|uniref:cobalt transporter CbiM n=1 Tax=Leptothermofonsia sp. ETS-13 TaxID=3035696 RepID=UPI003BA362C9